jgi:hypothetical protein
VVTDLYDRESLAAPVNDASDRQRGIAEYAEAGVPLFRAVS